MQSSALDRDVPRPAIPPSAPSPELLVVLAAVESVLLAPILAIVLAFGEEYGWRAYLQAELCRVGRVRGVLAVGVIWGMWHWPLILMGWSYPGYPLVGLLLTVLFTIGLAVALGYVVFKTGSILLAAYLHALNDQVTGFLVFLGFKPFDPVFSFGVGIYGLIVLAIIALVILRDPLWRSRASANAHLPVAFAHHLRAPCRRHFGHLQMRIVAPSCGSFAAAKDPRVSSPPPQVSAQPPSTITLPCSGWRTLCAWSVAGSFRSIRSTRACFRTSSPRC